MANFKKGKLTPEQEAALGDLEPTNPMAVDPAPSADRPPVARWRIRQTKTVSYFGQIVTMVEGDVLVESSYGKAGIARLQDAGVQMDPV